MSTIQAVIVGVSLCLPVGDAHPTTAPDLARLREVLHDRGQPVEQSQAALLLLQVHNPDADRILHRALQELESPDVFLAVTSALRLCEDPRFNADLWAAVVLDRAALRQSAADTLAMLADPAMMRKLEALAANAKARIEVRQAVLLALGRSGRRHAAATLIAQLNGPDALKQTAADALTELTGHAYGDNVDRWRAWWAVHGQVSDEHWLQDRLYYQASRARRLADELERSHSQVLHLEQQLYSRLPTADRLNHVLGLVDADDADVRALAVGWSMELLPGTDAAGRQTLSDILLRLSHDSAEAVQRQAVLALGRLNQPRAFARLSDLLRTGRTSVRAAAARAMTQQAGNGSADGAGSDSTRRGQVVGALQKALEDPSWQVVVEAAEDLGSLGVPEAGPVLTALLHHSSEPVRQTAARALERVADVTVLDGLLTALTDSTVAVRFSLVGALGHAAGDGHGLTVSQRVALLDRLEDLLERDPDAGVRSRAATVLGQCGTPELLPLLWRRLQAAEDIRVQDKAWLAMVAIIARSKNLLLLKTWAGQVAGTPADGRRLQLLSAVADAWKAREETASLVGPALEALVQAQLDQEKWASALPLIRELLKRPSSTAETQRRLRWLLLAGQQALQTGNPADCLHIAEDAQPYLRGNATLAAQFMALSAKASAKK
jgi:HEAT repeat protein